MGRISREEEARLAAEFEQDADNEEQWEEVPAPVQRSRSTLGTQVTIRLDPATAEQLRQVARDQGVNYTTLIRNWIQERLSRETSLVRSESFQIAYAGESIEKDAVHGSAEGEVRLVRLGAA